MKCCTKYTETLFLDVYGELPPQEKVAWKKHLATCESCRDERQRLVTLLAQSKEALPSPALRPEEENRIKVSLHDALNHKKTAWWHRKGNMKKLVPAALAAALVLVILGGFKADEFRSLFRFGPDIKVADDLEQPIQAMDLEIIQHMELLEEMESLRKLVQVMDQREMI
jgi:hypothetical protein